MTKRAYNSPLRVATSAATRERIVDAAQRAFEAQGFAGTTMRAIAQLAGTSVESVNLAGTKRELLMAALDRATSHLETDGAVFEFADPMAAFDEADAVLALSNLMAWVAAANQRISRVWRALDQAADTDPNIRADYADLLSRMRAQSSRVIAELATRRALRSDLGEAALADLLWLVSLPDQHRRLCVLVGWSQERYLEWLTWAAMTSLLAPQLISRLPVPAGLRAFPSSVEAP